MGLGPAEIRGEDDLCELGLAAGEELGLASEEPVADQGEEAGDNDPLVGLVESGRLGVAIAALAQLGGEAVDRVGVQRLGVEATGLNLHREQPSSVGVLGGVSEGCGDDLADLLGPLVAGIPGGSELVLDLAGKDPEAVRRQSSLLSKRV